MFRRKIRLFVALAAASPRSTTHAGCLSLAAGLAATPAFSQVLYSNGNVATGQIAGDGTPAPAGTQWSELAEDCSFTWVANTVTGFNCASANGSRCADDFTIPLGPVWNITSVRFFGHQTGSTTASPFTAATLRIFDGHPNDATSTVLFGDTTTNRLASSTFSGIYRIFSSTTPPTNIGPPTLPSTARPLFHVDVAVGIALPPGIYWLDWDYTGSLPSGPWATLTTLPGCGRMASPAPNALQSLASGNAGSYVQVADAGQGTIPTAVAQDFAFEVHGTTPGPLCYANCDGSTSSPFLNVLDFVCFSNAFSSGSGYANCDQSTTTPTLNVADFICFLKKYAAGCP